VAWNQIALSGNTFYDIAMIAYFASYVIYALHGFIFRKQAVGAVALGVLCAAFALHTTFLVERALFYYAQYGGFVLPAVSMFEAISYFAWLIVLIYIPIENFMLKSRYFGMFALLPAVGGMAYAALASTSEPNQMMPALKSYWLVFHITAMFLSYAAFAIAFSFAIMYVMRSRGARGMERIDPRFDLKYIDETANKLILTGFPMLTLGILLGAVWAYYAWGRFWQWDPKENWALITWMIYLAYLHLRVQWNWTGYRSALFNMTGFVSVIITFDGVNLLVNVFGLASEHSYAQGGGGVFMLIVLGLAFLIPIVLHFLPQPAEEPEAAETGAGPKEQSQA
jgi:cytochrome c-type biogenesis protein CcsB